MAEVTVRAVQSVMGLIAGQVVTVERDRAVDKLIAQERLEVVGGAVAPVGTIIDGLISTDPPEGYTEAEFLGNDPNLATINTTGEVLKPPARNATREAWAAAVDALARSLTAQGIDVGDLAATIGTLNRDDLIAAWDQFSQPVPEGD